MESKYLKTSMRMAIALGIFLPALETVRRIHQILVPEYFFRWFDDHMLGGLLLLAAFAVSRNKPNCIEYLIAAWGAATGALALSLLGQLDEYIHRVPDAGIFSSGLVTIAKGTILAYIILGLNYAIKASKARAV
jgi:hypothetical protein